MNWNCFFLTERLNETHLSLPESHFYLSIISVHQRDRNWGRVMWKRERKNLPPQMPLRGLKWFIAVTWVNLPTWIGALGGCGSEFRSIKVWSSGISDTPLSKVAWTLPVPVLVFQLSIISLHICLLWWEGQKHQQSVYHKVYQPVTTVPGN